MDLKRLIKTIDDLKQALTELEYSEADITEIELPDFYPCILVLSEFVVLGVADIFYDYVYPNDFK